MNRTLERWRLWIAYAACLLVAATFGASESAFSLDVRLAGGKVAVIAVYLAFLAYSLISTRRENFFGTLGTVNGLWWGRQIGIDLYIGVALSLALIWLVEGSILVLALWLVPILVFASLMVLPWLILNYGAVVERFVFQRRRMFSNFLPRASSSISLSR